jgi:ABC-type glycerol-3-phosphate transport system permease component
MSAAASPFSSTFRRHPRARALVHLALIAMSVIFVFPLLWMLSTSLKPIEDHDHPPRGSPATCGQHHARPSATSSDLHEKPISCTLAPPA